ncbi:alpha/beta hydrolase [Jatrophihabitans sp. YIM 134969]
MTLDPLVRTLVEGARHPPYLYEMGSADGRCALAEMQTAPVPTSGTRTTFRVPTRDHDHVTVHLLEPEHPRASPSPVVVYAHGGGWSMGDYRSHARFAHEVVRRSSLPVLFVEYGLTPETRYPTPLHQLHDVVDWVQAGGLGSGVDTTRTGLLGDCAGATLSAAVALTHRGVEPLAAVALLYPFSAPDDADGSGREFGTGYALRMADVRHLWREYVPRPSARTEVGASPLTAVTDRLAHLPPTLVVTAEADVTRDPAEAFAARIRAAGGDVVCTRYLGTIHDFAVLDALRRTPSARSAVVQAARFLADTLTADTAVHAGRDDTRSP